MLGNPAIRFSAVKKQSGKFEPARTAAAGLANRQPSRAVQASRSIGAHAQAAAQATSPCGGQTMSFDNQQRHCYPCPVDSAGSARSNLPLRIWELPLRME